MNRAVDRWILINIVRPPLLLLKFLLTPVDRLLFGWVDTWLARRNERRLNRDIVDAMPFLFAEHRGRVISNQGVPFPPGFDYAFVSVASDNLLIRFMRGRDELDVSVASAGAPNDWYELSLVLSLLGGSCACERGSIRDLRYASRVLESQLGQLKSVFAGDAYEDLRRRLGDAYRGDRVAMREAEWDINRRLM